VDPGVAVQVIVNGCPTVGLTGVADKLMVIGAVPASDTVIVAPSVTTFRTAFCTPAALGAKVTDTVQLAPAANDAGQAFVCANPVAFAAIEMPSSGSGTVPELVSVRVCGWLVVPTP
jgi:hypothetical protein